MSNEERTFIQELENGSYRLCTSSEIEQARKLGARLSQLKEQRELLAREIRVIESRCRHPVCWDEAGPMYDARHCLICENTDYI